MKKLNKIKSLNCLVLHVGLDNNDLDIIKYKLQEACNLVKSLNLKVAATKFLKLRNPSSGYLLSKGLLSKIKTIIEEKDLEKFEAQMSFEENIK